MAKITAVVDIGSNSARMIICQKSSRYAFHIIHEAKSRVRISQNCYEHGGILQEFAMQRAIKALQDFKTIANSFKCRKILCVATSALRDAPNKAEFLKKVRKEVGLNIKVIDEADGKIASETAVKLIANGEADFLMKGLVGTGTLLKAFLKKEYGLRTDKRISHVALVDIKKLNRLVVLTDAAMNTYPNLQEKKAIVENAVEVLNALGVQRPKVAALAAIETVNEKMPPTVDAALLSKMAERGQIKNCEIDGPLAFDVAMSKEAAHHKGLDSNVAGEADILLVPNIEAGNIVYKSLAIFSDTSAAMAVVGAKVPVLVTSRSDSYMVKFYSLALCKLVTVWGIA